MMKKTLIAAGVAVAMTVPAIASADVSLTARLQAELTSTSSDNDANDGLRIGDAYQGDGNVGSGNWSRVDLKASHDLGNGLSAIGHVSWNIDPSNVANKGTRESLVGLQGNFGTVMMGRMTNAAATNGKDPFNGTFMQARGNGGMASSGAIGNAAIGNGGYLSEALGYKGKLGVVSLGATIGLDPDNEEGNHAYAVLADVDLNPVNVWVGYASGDEYDGLAPDDDAEIAKIGASFKTGAFSVMAQYEDVKDDISFMMVAGTYTMGANTFMLGYGVGDAEVDGEDQQWIALGMNHRFTRQVSAHVGVRSTEYAENNAESTVVGAGMRVTF